MCLLQGVFSIYLRTRVWHATLGARPAALLCRQLAMTGIDIVHSIFESRNEELGTDVQLAYFLQISILISFNLKTKIVPNSQVQALSNALQPLWWRS